MEANTIRIFFKGIPVNGKMVYVAELIVKTRKFRLIHGGVLCSEDTLGRRLGTFIPVSYM